MSVVDFLYSMNIFHILLLIWPQQCWFSVFIFSHSQSAANREILQKLKALVSLNESLKVFGTLILWKYILNYMLIICYRIIRNMNVNEFLYFRLRNKNKSSNQVAKISYNNCKTYVYKIWVALLQSCRDNLYFLTVLNIFVIVLKIHRRLKSSRRMIPRMRTLLVWRKSNPFSCKTRKSTRS